MKARQHVQDSFLALVLKLQLSSVQVDPLSPLAVVGRLVAEDRDVRVFHQLHS